MARPRTVRAESNTERTQQPQPRVYVLKRKGGIVYRMSSDATTYDSTLNSVRAIRYCPNEPSIYTDEQSPYATREHIIFEEGVLAVPVNKPNLAAFMDAHPENVVNGGSTFALLESGKKAEEEMISEFLVHDAITVLKDKQIKDLLPVAMYYGINTRQSNAEIRRELLREAKANPSAFIASFDNPIVSVKAEIMEAIEYQIIKVSEDGVYWFDSNRLIIAIPVGQNGVDVIARFCMTEKGATTHAAIKEKLDQLS